MIFIECCITSDDGNRCERPGEMHTSLARSDSMQNQQTQYEIFGDMARFADEIMEKEQSLL